MTRFINDILATRTKEESGNYYVKKFKTDAKKTMDLMVVYQATDTTSGGATPTEDKVSIQYLLVAYVQDIELKGYLHHTKRKTKNFDTYLNKQLLLILVTLFS